ncbi:MAG: hypothetical protein FJ368_01910 [Pelagibacterales bacterium]|nr:hypothetical protein [Pelagibacterales bacterium]
MTEENVSGNQTNKKSNKLVIIIVSVFVFIIVSSYFAFSYLQKSNNKNGHNSAKSNNSDDGIFDISEEYLNSPEENPNDLTEISIAELQEKGSEFVYQMLLKNQIQINELRTQIKVLREDFEKYKSRETFSKMVFSYINLRQKVFAKNFANQTFDENLQDIETISILDSNLHEKVMQLRPILKDFIGSEKLISDFKVLIPEIIATKNDIGEQQSFLFKIRHKISQLIVIRRIDEKNPNDIDSIVVRIEKLLKEQNYQEAMQNLLMLDQSYHQITADFLVKLNVAVELQRIDSDILSYLKTLN